MRIDDKETILKLLDRYRVPIELKDVYFIEQFKGTYYLYYNKGVGCTMKVRELRFKWEELDTE